MDTLTVRTGKQGWATPSLAAIPFAMILFGFYGTFLPFGLAGILAFAAVGGGWALALGFVANRLLRRQSWHARLANASILLSIIALGFMAGGGTMYIFMMFSVLEEPTTTYAILSALMQPGVPFFIFINTLLELLVMLFVIYFNWDVDHRRKNYSLVGVALYLAMRIWTYLVYAETRLDISNNVLSVADVEWFRQTLAVDYRVVLELVAQVFFILAAMIPLHSARDNESIVDQ